MNTNICDDCKTLSNDTREISACTDDHLFGYKCCTKTVCVKCTYKCANESCQQIYKVNIDDSYDNFYEFTRCPYCDFETPRNICYWGDLRKDCQELCGCSMYKNGPIVVNGTKE